MANKQSSSGPFEDIDGATSSSYNTGSLNDTTYYQVLISSENSGCDATTSTVAAVNVTPDVSITAQPMDANICAGGDATLTVETTVIPGRMYQWQMSISSSGPFEDIDGATSSSYNTGSLFETTWYRVIIGASENGCDDATSTTATITVFPDISISAEPMNDAICEGGVSTLSVTAQGSPTNNYSYQWQDSIAGGNWANVSETGGTTSSFTTDPLTVTTYYRVIIGASENGCGDATSATATITVFPDISISAEPMNDAICEGGVSTLSVTAQGSPTNNYSYQWQDSIAGGNWANVSETGGTTSSFTTDALFETTWYRVIIGASENGCGDATSATATITVFPDISISAEPMNDAICEGGVSTLSVTAQGSPTNNYSYQWQDSIAGGSWANVSETGGTTSSFTTDALFETT